MIKILTVLSVCSLIVGWYYLIKESVLDRRGIKKHGFIEYISLVNRPSARAAKLSPACFGMAVLLVWIASWL